MWRRDAPAPRTKAATKAIRIMVDHEPVTTRPDQSAKSDDDGDVKNVGPHHVGDSDVCIPLGRGESTNGEFGN